MSQILACKSPSGIVLAADATAVGFDANGVLYHQTIQRLHPLSQRAAILAGGAPEGESICRGLKSFIAEEGLVSIDEIYAAALPYLATAYERFMRKQCEWLPVDPIHHLHFILAGHTDSEAADPFRIYLIWTKKKLPQLDSDEVDTVYAVPRMMAVEHRLARECREGASLDTIVGLAKEGLSRQTELHEDIGEPISMGLLTPDGYEGLEG